jgi:hypothetical protein
MSNLYRGPSIGAAYQVSVHLAKWFQRRLFRNQPIRNKNCLWWPCLLTDRDEMSNLNKSTFHRCFLPSFGSFGHAISEEKAVDYEYLGISFVQYRQVNILFTCRSDLQGFLEL